MHVREHLRTVGRHRRLVRHYCLRLGLVWQGLTHDLSKYSPTEFWRSAKYYQGYRSPNDQERKENGVSLSWLHHKGRNRHHFEYWIDYCLRPDGSVYMGGCKMPKRYVAEMFCDRLAASKVYRGKDFNPGDPYQFYLRGKDRRLLIHPATAELLESMLVKLRDEGEDAAFAYFDKLAENVLQFTASGSGPMQALTSGEAMIGLGMTFQAAQEISKGAELEIHFHVCSPA